MSRDMGQLTDRLWRGEAAMTEWTAAVSGGAINRISDDVIAVHTGYLFGNVTAIRTGDGLVLVDTGSRETASSSLAAIRSWDDSPIHTVIYTHGHIDHSWGARLLDEEADAANRPRPRIIAHRNVVARFKRYDDTRGLNTTINGRQFNKADFQFPSEHRLPDETYEDQYDLAVGGHRFTLMHGRGETDDATFVWLPEQRLLVSGDFVIWAFPNAGNPQKVQRFAPDWASALRRMLALGAETLIPGHGPVVTGVDRVSRMLEDGASVLESIVTQTRELMNEGRPLDQILQRVEAPRDLLAKPYLLPSYDDPEFVVRNIWRLYGGWYDGNPAHLKPAPEAELAAELAELAGGAGSLAARAEALATAGRLRLAAHLIELAVAACPASQELHRVRAGIYGQRAHAETSLIGGAIFAAAQRDSQARTRS
jgi:alkyl sulfatase BDS1-like metallo-beta-lactamase superfamily hydrolase